MYRVSVNLHRGLTAPAWAPDRSILDAPDSNLRTTGLTIHSLMELSTSREAANCAATQETATLNKTYLKTKYLARHPSLLLQIHVETPQIL
jgi:hypothetical protein